MNLGQMRGTVVVAAMMLGVVGIVWAQGGGSGSTQALWWPTGSGWAGNGAGLGHHGYAMGGHGPGTFAPSAPGRGAYGSGMMGGGMMGPGMMGGAVMGGTVGPVPPDAKPLADNDIVARFQAVLPQFPVGARIDDVMFFTNNAYAQVVDAEGNGLAELIADRFTGALFPEPGPNMMWNATGSGMSSAYGGPMGAWGRNPASAAAGGMMGWDGAGRGIAGGAAEQPSYDQQQARELANRFLEGYAPGATVLQSQTFPGYFTFDYGIGTVQGMLSVNDFTGAVWPHTWHGTFVGGMEP